MFRSSSQIGFRCSKEKQSTLDFIEQELEILGNIQMSSSGGIDISGGKFDGFGYTTTLSGRVTERDGRYSVNLDYEAKPGFVSWIIGICLFPIGLAIFILPHNARSDMRRKGDQILAEIKNTLDER